MFNNSGSKKCFARRNHVIAMCKTRFVLVQTSGFLHGSEPEQVVAILRSFVVIPKLSGRVVFEITKESALPGVYDTVIEASDVNELVQRKDV